MEPLNNTPMEETEVNNIKTPDPMEDKKISSIPHPLGPTVGIVLVVLLLILGALYFFWYDRQSVSNNTPSAEEIKNADDPVITGLESQSDSDDVSSIEQDLNATSFTDLDADASTIDSELAQ